MSFGSISGWWSPPAFPYARRKAWRRSGLLHSQAANEGGELNLLDPLTIDEALHKAVELRDRGFRHISLINRQTGAEVADLEELMRSWKSNAPGST